MWRLVYPRRAGHRRPGGHLLLLVGTPGAGKRALGGYLADCQGYLHLDFEDGATRRSYLEDGAARLLAVREEACRDGRGIVVTWNARSASQLAQIRQLRLAGFEPWWLDSDGGAARAAHFAVALGYGSRMRVLDPFEPDGRFRPLEEVARTLLESPASARTRLPRPERAGALRRRAVLGAGLAGAAVATCASALLVALGGGSPQRVPAAALAPAGSSRLRPAVGLAASRASVAHGALPRRGILDVSARSLAGIQLGDTMSTVRRLWGGHFTDCTSCKPAEWLYFLPNGIAPAGAGVQFAGGRVVAVFTLGTPFGWRSTDGLEIGQILLGPLDRATGEDNWEMCDGYGAGSNAPSDDAVTWVLNQGSSVYGFALTRPSVSPCQ